MRAIQVVHRHFTFACCLYPPLALPLFCPTPSASCLALPCPVLPCPTMSCPALCLALPYTLSCPLFRSQYLLPVRTCALRSHDNMLALPLGDAKRSLCFASMLAKQKQAFRITQGRSELFVLCEQNKFIDLSRSHVVSTLPWPLTTTTTYVHLLILT
jgi:hypothetical protein